MKIFLIFLEAVFFRANEHFWIGLVGNRVIKAVGSAINGKYCNNMGRKSALGLTTVLATAIIRLVNGVFLALKIVQIKADPVRNSIRGNDMAQKENF